MFFKGSKKQLMCLLPTFALLIFLFLYSRLAGACCILFFIMSYLISFNLELTNHIDILKGFCLLISMLVSWLYTISDLTVILKETVFNNWIELPYIIGALFLMFYSVLLIYRWNFFKPFTKKYKIYNLFEALLGGIFIFSGNSFYAFLIEKFGVSESHDLMQSQSINLLFLSVVFLIPVAEELFFRGVLLEFLNRVSDRTKAKIISSILFALVHPLKYFPAVIFSAIILCKLNQNNESIDKSIVAHALNNLLTLLIFK